MIQVICSAETYIYNTYHMTKAFYPSAEVTSGVDEKASNYVTVEFLGKSEETDAGNPKTDSLTVSEEDIVKYVREDFANKDFDGKDFGSKDFGSKDLESVLTGDAKRLKYYIDIALYHLLKERTGRELAWGILMGVRPTKIAMQGLMEGEKRESITKRYEKELLVSREKALLALEIAGREKALIERLDLENGYSLYVGIPFCPSVCSYCSFSSGALSDWEGRVDEYVDALCKELAFIAKVSKEKKLNTIYIGGGTPTTLNEAQFERLLGCIDEHFSGEHLLEYTVEAGRPDSITWEKLRIIKDHGATRISINPQTMQQKTLDLVGRRHSVEETKDAYRMARELGFDNINMDLIAGLPGESAEDMEDTLRQIKELDPDNLTVHALAIKRAAKMGQKDSKEYEAALARHQAAEKNACAGGNKSAEGCSCIEVMISAARKTAEQMGMSPYYLYRQKNIAGNFENVGYAKVDKAGIYNILIMEEKQTIVACGAGSVSKRVHPDGRIERSENVKDVSQYIERIGEMIERKRVLLED